MLVGGLELDLEVFSGPFDLLLTLVLNEGIDLLEVPVAEVVYSYLELLNARGELDVDAASEFIVLAASVLELKSRLMLRAAEDDAGVEFEPDEVADELLGRMLDARRFRAAAGYLGELLAKQPEVRYRVAALPRHLRRSWVVPEPGAWAPACLAGALAGLLELPAEVDVSHLGAPRVGLGERIAHVRGLLGGASSIGFDQAVAGADRVTVAVTLFALLELYKEGQADWTQPEPFGEITIRTAPGCSDGRGKSRRSSR